MRGGRPHENFDGAYVFIPTHYTHCIRARKFGVKSNICMRPPLVMSVYDI